ncbi:YraN family protein [Coprobacter sp.]
MAKHNQIGKSGEEYAMEYLIARGYVIRDINWKNGKLELDIVAYKDRTLIIVEVKTRSSEQFEHPEDAVDNRKIRHIIDATDAYIQKYDLPFEVRFDIISVIRKENEYKIEHIPDAFYPPLQ